MECYAIDFDSGLTRVVGDLDLRLGVAENYFNLDLEELDGSQSPRGRCDPKDMLRGEKNYMSSLMKCSVIASFFCSSLVKKIL